MAEQVTKQEQTVRLAPFQESYLEDIFKSAKDLTGSGTQMPYSAQQLAGLSPAQQQAITGAMGGVGSYQPYLQAGSEALGQGIGAVGTGLGTIGTAFSLLKQESSLLNIIPLALCPAILCLVTPLPGKQGNSPL